MEKTLEQILADFNTTKAKVDSIKSGIEAKNNAMIDNDFTSKLAVAFNSVKDCTEMLEWCNSALKNPLVSDVEKTTLEDQKKSFEEALNEANNNYEKLKEQERQYKPTAIDMLNLQRAEENMQEIIKFFMGDPAVNEYLKGRFTYEYDLEINSYDKRLLEINNKYSNLESVLSSDEFKTEVDSLRDAYDVLQTITNAKTSTIEAKDFGEAYNIYARAIDTLTLKLKVKGFNDVVLLSDDFESIAKGQINNLPSKTKEEDRINQEKTKIELKKDKRLALLNFERVASTETVEIPKDLLTRIQENDRQLTATTDSLTEIDNNKTRLDELVKQATLAADSEEVTEFKNALDEYKGIVKKLKDAGYIDENVVVELKDPNSEVSKSYETYKTANKAVREAMLTYQAEPSDENKTKLKEKIDEYDRISTTLETASDTKRDLWNRYYLEQIVSIAKENGTDIDPIFLDDTAINRIQRIEKEKLVASKKTEPLKTSTNELMEDQKHILDGKDATNFENHLTNYSTNYNDLSTALKIEPAQLASIIKAAAMKKISKIGNFFRKINIFKGKKEEIKDTPKIEYPGSFTDEDKEKAKACYDRIKRAYDAKNNKEKTLLDDAERNELETLQKQAESKPKLETEKTRLEDEQARLKEEKLNLPTVAVRSKITNASNIQYIDGKQGIIEEVKRVLDDNERDDR